MVEFGVSEFHSGIFPGRPHFIPGNYIRAQQIQATPGGDFTPKVDDRTPEPVLVQSW
jgi:hypothetical protein